MRNHGSPSVAPFPPGARGKGRPRGGEVHRPGGDDTAGGRPEIPSFAKGPWRAMEVASRKKIRVSP